MKKFDLKKLLAVLVVLIMAITVFAACKPEDPDDPVDPVDPVTPVDPNTPDEVNTELLDSFKDFYDDLFGAADKVLQNASYEKDGNIYLSLGLGLELTVDTNDTIALDIAVQAFIDRTTEGSLVTSGDKVVGVTNDNTSAIKAVISANGINMLSIYYTVNNDTCVAYTELGGNKVAINISDIDSDIQGVTGSVVNAIEGILENSMVQLITDSFGDPDYGVNDLLNDIISSFLGEGKSLIGLIKEYGLEDMLKPLLGDDYDTAITEDALVLNKLLPAVSASLNEEETAYEPFLFTAPVDNDYNGQEISLNLEGLVGGMLKGMIPVSDVTLGYTKADDSDMMEGFYIVAGLGGLGESGEQSINVKITLKNVNVDSEKTAEELTPEDFKAEDYGPLQMGFTTSIVVPANLTALKLGESGKELVYIIGATATDTYPEGAVLIPAGTYNITVDGQLDLVNPADTKLYAKVTLGNVVLGEGQYYYDTTAKGVIEVKANMESTVVKGVLALISANALGTDDIGVELQKFCTSGNLRMEGIDLYNLIFHGTTGEDSNYEIVVPSAEAAADEEVKNTKTVFEGKIASGTDGLWEAILTLVSFESGSKKSVLTINGENALSTYLPMLFATKVESKDKNGNLVYSEDDDCPTTLESILAGWAAINATDKDGNSLADADYSVKIAHWNEVLKAIQGYFVKVDNVNFLINGEDFTTENLGKADAKLTLTVNKDKNVITSVEIGIEVSYPTSEDAKVTVTVTLDNEASYPEKWGKSWFTEGDTVATLIIEEAAETPAE